MATNPDFLVFKLSDIIMILAVLAGPIAAVQVQKFIEAFRERKARQHHIFRILMATRATRMAPDHIAALNLIDIDFSEKKTKEKNIVRAWGILLDKLGSYPDLDKCKDENEFDMLSRNASEKSSDALVELLFEMSKLLGYDYDKTRIKNGCYIPKGHIDQENELTTIRKLIVNVLSGKNSLSMDIQSLPSQEPNENVMDVMKSSANNQKLVLGILEKISSGEIKVPVKVEAPEFKRTDKRKPITGNR